MNSLHNIANNKSIMGRVKQPKAVIGRVDIADFPMFNLKEVPVKIDSGAYTSTIHCSKIKENNGVLEVVFLSKKDLSYTGEKVIFTNYTQKKVRSSSGEAQIRYKVQGNIRLFEKNHKTEFTLSKRGKMRYPVLLGRKLLNNKFLIDTSLKNQSNNLKNTENK